MPARRTLLARLLWRGNSQRNRGLSGAGRSGTSIASVRRSPSLRPRSFPGMALDRATTIGERGETLAPFERKGGIAPEAGMSIGRFQIFLNTRGLSGVTCLSDESCSSVDTQVSGGGAARDYRRVAIGQPGENPARPRACSRS